MSLWAYDINSEIIDLSRGDVPIIDKEYFCPSCNCKMYYKSAGSNNRTAHFAGHHDDGCDIGVTSNSDGYIYDYHFNNSTLQEFYNRIIKDGVKEPMSNNRKKSNPYTIVDTIRRTEIKPQKILKTTRQMFNVFASSNPNDIIYDNIRVRDVYCGKSTAYLYTKYINGLHLVYAEYSGFSEEKQYVFLRYPTCRETQIVITCHIEKKDDFEYYNKVFVNHKNKSALLFADIKGKYCSITSRLQLVPLRK